MINFNPIHMHFKLFQKHQQNQHDHYQTKNQFSIPLLLTSNFSNHTQDMGMKSYSLLQLLITYTYVKLINKNIQSILSSHYIIV